MKFLPFTLLIFSSVTSTSSSKDSRKYPIRALNKSRQKTQTEIKDHQAKKTKRTQIEDRELTYYTDDYYDDDDNDVSNNDGIGFPNQCSSDLECAHFYGYDADDEYYGTGDPFGCMSPVCNNGICSIGFLSCAQCLSPQGTKDVEVSITTDDYPMETMWNIRDTDTGQKVMQGGPYKEKNYAHSSVKCFASGTYKFTIWDYWADGFHGDYSVIVEGEVVGSAGTFPAHKNEILFSVTECVSDLDCGPSSDDICTSSPTCTDGFCSSEYLTCADCNLVKDVEFSMTTDNHPSEIAWNIVNRVTGIEVMKGDSYTGPLKTYTSAKCFDYGSYKFTILDSYGDGLLGEGKYSVVVGGREVGSGENFFIDKQEKYFDVTDVILTSKCSIDSDCDDDIDICTLSKCENGYCLKEYLSCSVCGLVEDVEVLVTTDYYTKISWDIMDTAANKEVMKGGSYVTQDETFSALKCFDYGRYKFTISDSDRNGYSGNYYLLVGGQEIEQGTYYGEEKEMYFNIARECISDADCANADVCTTSTCTDGNCLQQYLTCADCNLAAKDVEIFIKTDGFPSEVSWTILEVDSIVEVMGGGDYTVSYETYTSTKCFESGNYKFTIFDVFGDGLGMGSYTLRVDGQEVGNGGVFNYYEEVNFNIPAPDDLTKVGIGEWCGKNNDCYSTKCKSNTCCERKGKVCSAYDECCSENCNSGFCV